MKRFLIHPSGPAVLYAPPQPDPDRVFAELVVYAPDDARLTVLVPALDKTLSDVFRPRCTEEFLARQAPRELAAHGLHLVAQ